MIDILPHWLYEIIIHKFSLDCINEIRLRRNQCIQVDYKGKVEELKTDDSLYGKSIIATDSLIEQIMAVVTKQSLYAFQDQIKEGYIVTENGFRIGLCGTAVYNKGEIVILKNITSLNIRIAHNVQGCSNEIIRYLVNQSKVKNTLIISPPGAGKTTLIRDLIKNLSNKYDIKNIIVIDEKCEINGEGQNFDLGKNVDIMQMANKRFGFYNSIRYMNPNVIVADEIITNEDIDGIMFAIKSGVNVVASVHANNLDELKTKKYFSELIAKKYFERFVVMSKRNGVGTIEGVFDENNFALYLPYLSR